MKIIVKNRSNQSMSHMGPYLKSFLPFAQKRLGFNRPPTIFFDSDADNSEKVLGKTGYYDPDASEVVIFIDKRHPKDILRSLSHELVHHSQNCRGDLEPEIAGETGPGYAQTNPHMRQMESEAYKKGNLCMRDWEDKVKIQLSMQVELQETNYLHITGDSHKMATYEQLKEQITKKVVEALKEKMNEGNKKPDKDGDGVPPWADKDDNDPEVQEEGEAFAPNHYCVHHGGVQHEGKIHMAEVVGHNWSEKSQRVTHYDMKLKDGSVLENIAFENIQVTKASLAEDHEKHSTKCDDEEASNLREGNIHYEGLLKAVSDFTLEFLQGWHEEAKVELRQEIQANGFDISKVIMQSLGGGTPPMHEGEEELEERKKRNEPRNWRGLPSRLKEVELDEEEEIVNEEETVKEEENDETEVDLNESNDHWYQKQLFEKLSKRWTR